MQGYIYSDNMCGVLSKVPPSYTGGQMLTLVLLSTVKHVLVQPVLNRFPIDASAAVVHTLVRRDTRLVEERYQIADAVNLMDGVEEWPSERALIGERRRRCDETGVVVALAG